MANEGRSNESKQDDIQEVVYRGRTIRVERGREARDGSRLFIDDEEVAVEETESGVIAHHEMAFKEYGSGYVNAQLVNE